MSNRTRIYCFSDTQSNNIALLAYPCMINRICCDYSLKTLIVCVCVCENVCVYVIACDYCVSVCDVCVYCVIPGSFHGLRTWCKTNITYTSKAYARYKTNKKRKQHRNLVQQRKTRLLDITPFR